jgi:hypothetical protein
VQRGIDYSTVPISAAIPSYTACAVAATSGATNRGNWFVSAAGVFLATSPIEEKNRIMRLKRETTAVKLAPRMRSYFVAMA